MVSMQGAAPASDSGDHRSKAFESKHAEIIARTLRWADEAAARLDYAEALRWVETVVTVGESLPEPYDAKRRAWLRLLQPRSSALREDDRSC
jgi:hypothetical protein